MTRRGSSPASRSPLSAGLSVSSLPAATYANTQIRLVVDGKVVCATSGKDTEQLQPATWDVGPFQGQTAHIEIVDEQQGGWGHINVDQIEFTDMPGNRAVMQLLEELLPARFSGIHVKYDERLGLMEVGTRTLVLQAGANQLTTPDGDTSLYAAVWQGNGGVAAGHVLEPAQAGISHQRQLAYSWVCGLVGASYTRPEAQVFYTSEGRQHPKPRALARSRLAALADEEVTVLPAATHEADAWTAFAAEGRFTPLAQTKAMSPTPPNQTVYGAVATNVTLPAGRASKSPSSGLALSEQIQRRFPSGWAATTRPNGPTPGRCCVRQ
jgi:hypothetical protein